MKIDIHKSVDILQTPRVEMLGSMFEIPTHEKLSVSLVGDIPDDKDYNIGLIVGPSGSGKTLLLQNIFGTPETLDWNSRSVIDDFDKLHSMEDISRVCQSVGFNTIPSWLRPHAVLSNGEKFRVETARYLLTNRMPITIDEFTSVVDRQVAQFACHAIQKYVREKSKKLVVASCHYDIIDWLQPDWILEPGNPCRFSWRSLQRRPPIAISISRVKYETWSLFRDFHYMSQDLNKAARCYGLFVGRPAGREEEGVIRGEKEDVGSGGSEQIVNGDPSSNAADTQTKNTIQYQPIPTSLITPGMRIASMCGILHRPHPKVDDISGFTRMVTLPDFQGLGLAMVLATELGAIYKALGKRLHSYPNHPAWIRSYQRSKDWMQVKSAGQFSPRRGGTSTVSGFGGRRCAVFMYIGSAMNVYVAERIVHAEDFEK